MALMNGHLENHLQNLSKKKVGIEFRPLKFYFYENTTSASTP